MRRIAVPDPPRPFEPLVEELRPGSRLYRVFTAKKGRKVRTFNGSGQPPSRFAFFGEPPVPVLYAAESEVASLCESLLHDVPLRGGELAPERYERSVMGALEVLRPLRLAKLHGPGLRRLGVAPEQLTSSSARNYGQTVRWGEAVHRAGLDGAVWMSARCTSDRAYVLFGDRVSESDLGVAIDHARVFTPGPDLDWLIDQCAVMGVAVTVRTA